MNLTNDPKINMKKILLLLLFLTSCETEEVQVASSFVRPANNGYTPALLVGTEYVEIPEFSFEVLPNKAYQVEIVLAYLPHYPTGQVDFTATVDDPEPDINIFLVGELMNVGSYEYMPQTPKASFYLPVKYEYSQAYSGLIQRYSGYIENYSHPTTVRFSVKSSNRVSVESSRKMFVKIHSM